MKKKTREKLEKIEKIKQLVSKRNEIYLEGENRNDPMFGQIDSVDNELVNAINDSGLCSKKLIGELNILLTQKAMDRLLN